MIEADPDPKLPSNDVDAAVERIAAAGPSGAIGLAGIATAIVIAIWLAFYLFVFMPRAPGP